MPFRQTSREAVELLAAVHAEPISAQQPFTANTPIKDVAAAALDELRDALGPDECSAALPAEHRPRSRSRRRS